MPNYISRKKTLMGRRYEIEVPLEQYGGDVVRCHAIPDMELARIEDRVGFTLENAISALTSQGLTEEEMEILKGAVLSPETTAKVAAHLTDDEIATIQSGDISPSLAKKISENFTEEEIGQLKIGQPSAELTAKAAKGLSPKLTLFLGELCKAGIVPDPDCACKGKGCEDCDVAGMVEDFRGFSVLMVGMAIIGASTALWSEVESFFSHKKAPSGAA
jgi:hypothetical protein